MSGRFISAVVRHLVQEPRHLYIPYPASMIEILQIIRKIDTRNHEPKYLSRKIYIMKCTINMWYEYWTGSTYVRRVRSSIFSIGLRVMQPQVVSKSWITPVAATSSSINTTTYWPVFSAATDPLRLPLPIQMLYPGSNDRHSKGYSWRPCDFVRGVYLDSSIDPTSGNITPSLSKRLWQETTV